MRYRLGAEGARPLRTNLTIEDMRGLLDEPLVAVLSTLRRDGTSLLSPVWHRWHDGGFEFWIGAEDVKVRHLRRDPRATVLVAESQLPYRGVEVRGEAEFVRDDVLQTAVTIASRYVGREKGLAYVSSFSGEQLIVRVSPAEMRAWDFADDFG